MSSIFVDEHSACLSVKENSIMVKYHDGLTKRVPIENVDNIYLFSNAQVTTQCIGECLRRGIGVSYFSKSGAYFGRLNSTGHINVNRQRKQAALYNSDFALELSRKIIIGKIHNQEVVLKRYARSKDVDVSHFVTRMRSAAYNVNFCKSVSEVMGHEGTAARNYFEGLGKVVDEKFAFSKRTRRPPLDEFNSMLSLGYSILMNEIYGMLESKGLNPYFGFAHRDREKHPTLASDIMEEWRAVIIDSLVMSLVNGHEISVEMFTHDIDEPGYFLNKSGLDIFLKKYDHKMKTMVKYLRIDNKRRQKLSKILLGYGFRVQKSAFEAIIPKRKYNKLLNVLQAFSSNEDSIRVYKLLGRGQVTSFGAKIDIEDEDVILI